MLFLASASDWTQLVLQPVGECRWGDKQTQTPERLLDLSVFFQSEHQTYTTDESKEVNRYIKSIQGTLRLPDAK